MQERETDRGRERKRRRENPVTNGKIPWRNGPGLDDKQHAFILFGDGDSVFFQYQKHNHKNVSNPCVRLAKCTVLTMFITFSCGYSSISRPGIIEKNTFIKNKSRKKAFPISQYGVVE